MAADIFYGKRIKRLEDLNDVELEFANNIIENKEDLSELIMILGLHKKIDDIIASIKTLTDRNNFLSESNIRLAESDLMLAESINEIIDKINFSELQVKPIISH